MDAASRTYTVKIDLPPLPSLRSGMFGRAVVSAGLAHGRWRSPRAAVVERGQLQSVFVVEDGAARTRLITTGQTRAGDRSKCSPA